MKTSIRRRVLTVFVVAFLAIGFSAGCSRNKVASTEKKAATNQLAGYLEGQPIPSYKYSQLRQNLIEIQTAQANGIATTTFFFHTGNPDPIKSCPSIGYPIPSTYQLTNPLQKLRDSDAVIAQIESTGVYTGDSTATYVICIDEIGKARATYWEGFVQTENGPATWDTARKQIVSTGQATGEFTVKK